MNTYGQIVLDDVLKHVKQVIRFSKKNQADVFCKGSCGCYEMLTQLPAAQPSKSKTPFFYSKAELYCHCSLESHNHYKRENKNQHTTCHSQGIERNLMTDRENSVIFFPLKIKIQTGCFLTDRCLCQRGVFFIIFISYTAAH